MVGNKLVVVAIALVAIVVTMSIAERTPPPQGTMTRMSRLDKVVRASRKAMQRIAAKSGSQDVLEVKVGDPAEEYEAVRGHDVEMMCGDGNAEKVNWYHNSILIDEATFADWRFEVVNATQNLHIYKVEEGDAGIYECYSTEKGKKAVLVGEGKLKTISIWGALNPFG